MYRTAITGMIGAGKSTVSLVFRELGLPVFDADVCTHTCLTAPHVCCTEIAEAFGAEVLLEDGSVDRAALSAVVFRNEEKRLLLNSIVHPHVLREMMMWMSAQKSGIVMAEVALLFEAGWDRYFDETIAVVCEDETAVLRMMINRGYTRNDAERRIRSQLDREEQIRRADTVFRNDGTLEDLRVFCVQWLEDRREKLWN